MKKLQALAMIAATSLALGACAKKPPADIPPPEGSADAGTGTGINDGSGVDGGPGSQADFLSKISSDRIYFDTDRFDVDGADRTILDSQAAWLRQYPGKRVTIEGHADERGTREYNIALGERRANSAKNYLASLGIDPGRIMVVSYGKERPEALGSTPEAWARNRRAVTVTIQ